MKKIIKICDREMSSLVGGKMYSQPPAAKGGHGQFRIGRYVIDLSRFLKEFEALFRIGNSGGGTTGTGAGGGKVRNA